MQFPLIGLLPMSEATHYKANQSTNVLQYAVDAVPQAYTLVNTLYRQYMHINTMPAKIDSALLTELLA
jgi:hypothetical protein